MDQKVKSNGNDRTAQQLVSYEALFKLLDEIQPLEDIAEISSRVAKQWKYFANVACWHLIVKKGEKFQIIDGFRGKATVTEVTTLSSWDAYHLESQLPYQIRINDLQDGPQPPDHLIGKAITEIEVLPFLRMGQCIGILSVAARHEAFNELDKKFVRIFGSHFTDRIFGIHAQKQIIARAHQAGMADIATGALHNVGNVLNSVKTSAQAIQGVLQSSELPELKKVNDYFQQNIDQVQDLLIESDKVKRLLEFYILLNQKLNGEWETITTQSNRLNEKVELIIQIIAAQQKYAGATYLSDEESLEGVVNDALVLQQESLNNYKIRIVKEFQPIPNIYFQKAKLIHILINIIKNAQEAMLGTPKHERRITILLESNDDQVYLKIKDTGEGLKKEQLLLIFSHGYTTKKNGYGFGLHSCANYMIEMNGSMWAESSGPGQGATLVLAFNLQKQPK